MTTKTAAPAIATPAHTPAEAPKPHTSPGPIEPRQGDTVKVKTKRGEAFVYDGDKTAGLSRRALERDAARAGVRPPEPAPAPKAAPPAKQEAAPSPDAPRQAGEAASAADPMAPEAKAAEPPGEAKAPEITESDLAQRVSNLVRREGKFAAEKRAHAGKLEVVGVLERAFGSAERVTKASVDQLVQRLVMVDQGRIHAAKDPLGFLQRVFGVDPNAVMRLAIDRATGEAARTPEQRQGDALTQANTKIAELEKRITESAEAEKRERIERQVRDYIAGPVAQAVADKEANRLIHKQAAILEQDPATYLYGLMREWHSRTGEAVSPTEAARRVNRNLSKHLGGDNAKPTQPVTQERTGAPPANEAPRRVTTADPPPRRRVKMTARPYQRIPQ